MIKLERNFIPEFFTQQDLARLTQNFKDNNTPVWHHPEVKAACLKLSYGKCAFCEVKLEDASTYNEVEHFKDKKTYPDEVISWENLLPACRHCNGSKLSHDVVNDPIINPCIDLPSAHLYMQGYRIKGKTAMGEQTVATLNFNHRDHKFIPRCKAGYLISDCLENALEKVQWYLADKSARRRTRLSNLVDAILSECQKTAPYAAVCATELHGSADYARLMATMKTLDLWTNYMQQLHDDSLTLVLPDTP